MERTRSSVETLEILFRYAKQANITRVADLSNLDDISKKIFVYSAVRPGSKSLSVSMGKSSCRLSAKCGAIAESLEAHYAEMLTPDTYGKCASDLSSNTIMLPSYESSSFRGFFSPDYSLNWNMVHDVKTGKTLFCPHYVLSLDSTIFENQLAGSNSDGLASGNTMSEALSMGILEQIERISVRSGSREEVECPYELVNKFSLRKNIDVQCYMHRNQYNIPVVEVGLTTSCKFRSKVVHTGFSASYSFENAFTRAMEEAIQSRVGEVSGARDDLKDENYVIAKIKEDKPENKSEITGFCEIKTDNWDVLLDQILSRVFRLNQNIFTFEYLRGEFNIIKVLFTNSENNIL